MSSRSEHAWSQQSPTDEDEDEEGSSEDDYGDDDDCGDEHSNSDSEIEDVVRNWKRNSYSENTLVRAPSLWPTHPSLTLTSCRENSEDCTKYFSNGWLL